MSIEEAIEWTLKQLLQQAELYGAEGFNIDNAAGEVEINGIEYQIQVSLISDKKLWCKEDEVRYSEVVKIHPADSLP